MLNKEDYMEPACFCDTSMCSQKENFPEPKALFDLSAVLKKYDFQMASGNFAAGRTILDESIAKCREYGDKKSEMSLLSELVGHCRQAGDRDSGMRAIEEALALHGKLGLAHTLPGGTILLNCATALHSFGELDRAISCFSEASRCYSQHLAPDDMRFTGLYNNFATAYETKGDYDMAEKLFRAALMILSDHNEWMDRAVTHLNLARLFYVSGRDQSLVSDELRNACSCFDSPEVIWDSYYAHTCRKCAGAFRAFGMDAYAQDLVERAESIMEAMEEEK